MNTGLAQLIALTASGNWALSGQTSVRPVDLSGNTVFRFVGELAFTTEELRDSELGTAGKVRVVARTPEEWFAALYQQGVRRLSLARTQEDGTSILPAHHAVAFAGGEQAAIVAALPGGKTELWVPGWQLGDRNAPDQRIWGVEYRGIPGPAPSNPFGLPLQEAQESLHAVLVEIARFAGEQDLESWVPHFNSADAILTGSGAPGTMGLFPPSGYPAAASRLLSAAMSAWVFGGMGSWNDTGPRDPDQQPRYDQLSAQLFDAIMNALVSATNSWEGDEG